jgi:serine protease Do
MFKKIIISLILVNSIFASSIVLNEQTKIPQRIDLLKQNKIISYNSSIKEAIKSIVNISTKQNIRGIGNELEQVFNDPFFKQFFNINLSSFKQQKQSLGSGIVISQDGYIVTNKYLIKNATQILVSFSQNSKQYEAKIIGIDNNNDLAILKIDAVNLQPIKISKKESLLLGDIVFTIGNPYAISPIVFKGIISVVPTIAKNSMQYENFIQTDAKINSLNAGGALIDSSGALIGINHSSNNNIGFVTPVNIIKKVIKNLIINGEIAKGYLGIDVQNIGLNIKKLYNHKKGVLVMDIDKFSSVVNANIKRGDLIYSINNKKISNKKDYTNLLNNFKYKEQIIINLERNKKNLSIKLTLDTKEQLSVNIPILNGLYVSELNSINKEKFRINKDLKGILINDIISQSQAEKVGFENGDVIVQIEDIETTNLKRLQKVLQQHNHKEKRVYVNRYGQLFIVIVK